MKRKKNWTYSVRKLTRSASGISPIKLSANTQGCLREIITTVTIKGFLLYNYPF